MTARPADSLAISDDRRSANERKKDHLYVEGFTGNDWGEKITFTVGITYFGAISIACLFGMFKGMVEGYPSNWKLPKKLILNNFFNSVGRSSARYGNASACASLMYCLTGSALNFLFEDELAEMTQFQKNVLCGVLTGGLYKSTLGIRPFVVGSLLGGTLAASLHGTISYFNEKGYIAFEMKY